MPAESPDLTPQTPMLRQYQEIKNQHPDAILLYRIGDFYEMFFEDAIVASKILEIVLTSRNKNDPNPVPLCGVPYHSIDSYIAKLLEAGKKVAVCDQVEDPREAKGIVRREVTRVLTPGLSSDPSQPKKSRYLAAITPADEKWGLAVVEFSTGDFFLTELSPDQVCEEILQREIREIVVPENGFEDWKKRFPHLLINQLPDWFFGSREAERILKEHFQVTSLLGFDCQDLENGLRAAGACLVYIRQTQKTDLLPHLSSLKRYRPADSLYYSEETGKSLDIDRLIALLDQTGTAMGGRRLREWIKHPLTDRGEIEGRLASVEELVTHRPIRSRLREQLKKIYDLERIAGRLSLKSANARDLVALASSLEVFVPMRKLLEELQSPLLTTLKGEWDPLSDVCELIQRSLQSDGIIANGVSKPLDELREISRSGKDWLIQLEEKERTRTGIPSLKVRYNKVFGYYLEVTAAHLGKVPADYIRKQTLTNAERYITPALKEFEDRILGAEEKSRQLEFELFCDLRDRIAVEIKRIQRQADRIAQLDLLTSFADLAEERHYSRPEIVEEPILEIQKGRHPIVEDCLESGRFVKNDLQLDTEKNRLLLITGPNMAGKSTLIRQAGLIVILAQVGSFVPAEKARVGIVDRLFSRIGASDRLAEGESTFMVEMGEVAALLRYATPRSLILLDEIGRGTSTFDGISIAWAVAEYLHDEIRAKTLFATHYHELTQLSQSFQGIQNYHVAVREDGERILFLYQLVPGSTSHSYGIHVAQLAGLPAPVIRRAEEILKTLEKGKPRNDSQTNLF